MTKQLLCQPVMQGIEPTHFVSKFFTARFLPVDKITVNYPQRTTWSLQGGCDNACLLINKPWNIAHYVRHGTTGKQRYPVISLLPMEHSVVASSQQLCLRKFFISELELLQSQDINRLHIQP